MPEKKEKKAKGADNRTAKKGDTVKVDYTGRFDDGVVFDTSEKREPIVFALGEGKVIKGFENAIVGMQVGEEKEIKVMPGDGYGERDDSLVRPFPKGKLPKERLPKAGMIVSFRSPEGRAIVARIDKIDEKEVFLDFNHPLAGKNLNFKLKLVDIQA